MKRWMVVALALGSQAGAIVPVAAKDLPRASIVTRPATGCEAFGPGFQKVAGTETCIKISGSVRAETSLSTAGASFWPGARR